MSAFEYAWALLKSDDFYEEFRRQNPNNPTMQEALRMQQEREFTDAFEPSGPRVIPESEYNPYDPSMVKVRGHGGDSIQPYKRPIDAFRERQPTGNENASNDFHRFLMDYYMNPPATEQRSIGVQEIMNDRDSYYD